MKKKIFKRILMLVIVITMIISTPLAAYFNVQNNVYASTFAQDIESELFKQTLIPILISTGLVLKSKEAAEEAVYELKDWLYDQGFDWQLPPDPEPEDPKLGDMIKALLASSTLVVWNSAEQIYQSIVSIPQWFWEFISTYANDNYDEGENLIELDKDYINVDLVWLEQNKRLDFISNIGDEVFWYYIKSDNPEYIHYDSMIHDELGTGSSRIEWDNKNRIQFVLGGRVNTNKFISSARDLIELGYYVSNNDSPIIIIGIEDIVDNPDYDWNNQYTGDKDIVIPIQSDIYGNPKIDENGYYLPAVETEEWVDVQPEEIPLLDPSGIPQSDIPEIPEHDEEDSKDTGILITIATILATLLSKITGIKNDTSTMVEKMPDTSTDGTGGIGDGIGEVPTGFEWGDFRHLLDIFFIFIYFIVILILILLKFLQVVFTGLPVIAANTDLFTQYPTILEGVNYIKNLQVGGMSITVQQAFEYIFLIFFYIFIIKQIRKLYNAHVFEQPGENQRNTKDMKLDYYDKTNNVIGRYDSPEEAERRRNIKLQPPNPRFNEDKEWDDWGV